ncbi:MAG: Asp-tRNA(Asn)/Glu-tRNA(Gln) amidotransferase subunit GatA [Planctomycetes bacterium]|nr:Asp-tRNA(Asn)/Glu-tRNA(Gln) amidotransferase subunit GatA [Planctomycetota bacterium]
MSEIHDMGVIEIAEAVRSGKTTALEVLEALRARIQGHDRAFGAFLRLDDEALDQARALDAAVAAGRDPGPLAGVPIAIKDNIHVAEQLTTCGSRILEDFRAPFEATAIGRLRAAGAIFIGKTNLDEFAMGSSTENSAFGPTRNPWDDGRTPGGSSGGSAAAVAARFCPAALGSDTGGSIRQPASFCGVLGLKPTYGRVSRYGLVAFGSSLDQIGPFTRSAADAARITRIMAGADPLDSTAATVAVPDYEATIGEGLEGLRLGVAREFMDDRIDARVRQRIQESVDAFARAGAEIVEVDLPHTRYAIPTYYIVATSEASSNLARYDGVGYGHRNTEAKDILAMFMKSRMEGFGDEVKRRIILGTYCLSAGSYDAFYDKALRVRSLLRRDFEQAFERCDLVLGPTTPTPPFRLGEKVDDPIAMYLADILTASLNLAGLPGASIPAGFVEEDGRRLPVGLQVIANRFREDLIFRVANAHEHLHGFAKESPIS